ncbi:Na+/H+ antiporter NhaC family protein [Mollicutes bacterium LVI A0039]|nr:Na+/H+ antiporter NhaC family protein [Mollicutes bacterium LVI A0039]
MLQNLANLDIMSIVPAIIAISLAFKLKNVYTALGLGLYSGIVLIGLRAGEGLLSFLTAFLRIPVFMVESLADSWNAGIVIQVLLIGGLVVLISYTGGLRAMANKLSKYGKTRMSAQLITWVMGLIIFFDDYANALIVGPVMRPITDTAKISREKLSFIIDATAAPITGLVLISTWIGFEVSLIAEQLTNLEIEGTTAMELFISSLPYRFYNILMLIFIVLTIYLSREYGPMLKAERRAQSGEVKRSGSGGATGESEDYKVLANYDAKPYEGIVPLITLIVSSFVLFFTNGIAAMVEAGETPLANGYNFKLIVDAFSNADASIVIAQAAVLAIIVSIAISSRRGAFKVGEALNITFEGASTLLPTVFVLLFAWSLGTVMSDSYLDAGGYIANTIGSHLPYQLIPLIIFVTAGIMAFATGTSFGTMGILFPLAMPLAWAANPEISFLTVAVGAILTGTIIGDHCSPISDTTILSSAGSDVDHLDHVATQMPYALTVGVVASVGYLLAGFGVNPWIIVILGTVALVAILMTIGQKIESGDTNA